MPGSVVTPRISSPASFVRQWSLFFLVAAVAGHGSGCRRSEGKVTVAPVGAAASKRAAPSRRAMPRKVHKVSPVERAKLWLARADGRELKVRRGRRFRRLSRRGPRQLKVLTYNIWGARRWRARRNRAILSLLWRSRAAVIALQEVSPWFLQRLAKAGWARRYAQVGMDRPGLSGGTSGLLLLSKYPILQARYQPLPGTDGRGALLVKLQLPQGQILWVLNTHLACYLNEGPLRAQQLDVVAQLLKGRPQAVFLGDLNFGDAAKLEEAHMPAGFADVWQALHPDKSGFTWDRAGNPLALKNSFPDEPDRRLDRVLVQGANWRPHRVSLVGKRPLRGRRRVFPSDHYGVVATFQRYHRPCLPWRPAFAKAGLLLTPTQRRALLAAVSDAPGTLPLPPQKRLIRRYDKVEQEVQKLRHCLSQAYQRKRSWRARQELVKRAGKAAYALLEEVILPLWLGTKWAFYGAAERPHQKSIACGYFVTHALKGLGFGFPQSQVRAKAGDPAMREYAFAKLPATQMMRLLSSPRHWQARFRRHPVKLLGKTLKRMGPGVYFLGLDTHVGLVLYDGKKARFWHSSSWATSSGVKRELLLASEDVKGSKYRRLGKIPLRSWRRWLQGKPVVVPKRWVRAE